MRRLFGLLLAGSILATSAASAQAAYPGSNGQVAFSADADSDLMPGPHQVFDDLGMAKPGGPITRLTFTNHKILETDASWAPSGTLLAFTRSRAGRPDQIFTINADGTGLNRVSRGSLGASDPTWSPDGKRIAFVRQNDIWVMDADGSHAHALTSTPAAVETDPAWSPLGGRIAYANVTSYPSTQVWTMDENGGHRVDITPSGTYDSSPDWAPDGSRLALARRTAADYQMGNGDGIATVRPDGTDPKWVWTPDFHVGSDQPAWSPDGHWLASVAGGFGVCFIDAISIAPDGSAGTSRVEIAGDIYGSGVYCHQDPTWQPLH